MSSEPINQPYERATAIREGEQIAASDAFFAAREHMDSSVNRVMFEHGFTRGWHRSIGAHATRASARWRLPEGWIAVRMEWEPGYHEDVAYGPQVMMDRLQKWLHRYYSLRDTQQKNQESLQPVYQYLSDVVNSDASEGEKNIARSVMRLLPMQIALDAVNASPQDALWCIFVPGPDEYHAAPSEQVALLMADKHNSAMTAHFKSNPPTDSAPSPESCAAHVATWPFEPEDHQAAMAEFDYAAWGIEPPTRQEATAP